MLPKAFLANSSLPSYVFTAQRCHPGKMTPLGGFSVSDGYTSMDAAYLFNPSVYKST